MWIVGAAEKWKEEIFITTGTEFRKRQMQTHKRSSSQVKESADILDKRIYTDESRSVIH